MKKVRKQYQQRVSLLLIMTLITTVFAIPFVSVQAYEKIEVENHNKHKQQNPNIETHSNNYMVPEKAYEIGSKIKEEKEGIINGEISIKNISQQTIEDWNLEFDIDADIEKFNNAEIIKREGKHYYLKNTGNNANIKPGQIVILEFIVNKGREKVQPQNYGLYQIINKSIQEDITKDSDNDKVLDYLEREYGTNPYDKDSDGDGINDYLEIMLLLNPLKRDSDGNGVEDGNEDSDKDGLANLKEIKLGTDCSKKDSDGDGLLDGNEVNIKDSSVYVSKGKSNIKVSSPLLTDTDGDSIDDGDEIKLGLNPMQTYSNGITHDSKRKFKQELDKENIVSKLKDNSNLFIPSVSASCSGVLDKLMVVNEVDNDSVLKNNAIVGKPIKIVCSGVERMEITLSYDYKNFLNHYDKSKLDYIILCRLKGRDFIPVQTVNDKEKKQLVANIKEDGEYLLLNVEKFLSNMDINIRKTSFSKYNLTKNIFEKTKVNLGYMPNNLYYNEINKNEDNLVLLDGYEYVQLKGKVDEKNGIDTDKDGISDFNELGEKVEKDLSSFINVYLKAKGIPVQNYMGKKTVTAYNYISSPVLLDTDYDGINDDVDKYIENNSFKGKLKTPKATSEVSYSMDYREFFKDNGVYSEKLGVVSSLYASVIYGGTTYDNLSIKDYMTKHGLSNIVRYDIASMYDDSDVSEAYIGHRKVTYNGTSKEIVAIIIRGTNGTIQEWTSNFDIGNTESKALSKDWVISNNHKGFDVVATRIMKCISKYEESGYIDKNIEKAYWITGHSRGAGIANILGARLSDEGKRVYSYTYAAPNTTTSTKAKNYKGIFNILNKDDFVPYLPMAAWGFKHYGKDRVISLADNYEKEWEDLTQCKNMFGVVDYNIDAIGMNDTIDKISGIVNERNQCYKLTCKCHGDGSSNNITIRNKGISKSSREEAIKKIPNNALPYCMITRYNGGWISGWDFEVCQQPEYFMQLLAFAMANGDWYRFTVELDIAKRYESAKSAIIRSGIGGLEHPHYVESYYVLSKHTSASQFN